MHSNDSPSIGIAKPPSPPPPPPPAIKKDPNPIPVPKPPIVASTGPTGAFVVDLLIFSGSPFKDHWTYWVRSHANPDIGVLLHATGDVINGFVFEIKRRHDFRRTHNRPTTRIPLQWVNAKHFDEEAMFDRQRNDSIPVCAFEAGVYKVAAPGKSLNDVNDKARETFTRRVLLLKCPMLISEVPTAQDKSSKKITQRNSQTWIIESARQLAEEGIFTTTLPLISKPLNSKDSWK
ncbi:hypothetical protein HRG_000269 [Hirsutella rhossiliensis]|uniref:Uncharacterized protein n=1 Tax=Hirsutella rhossiliensis TaxID=111463 RepID=A0A9P8N6W1_9HYPO|nr:uncharacterized protein HRG_00269 [Hirsutella rhossiliensis]KAH0967627.1 hypothetical protein HRG_00269 [Hirsutella rhossiliensis]